MIKSWTLENFKSISEKTTLEMAPLTIFAGANSSGKSTLIQSLLLTAQTLQNPVSTRPIILNGHIVRLGTFSDVVSHQHQSKGISIGFELVPIEDSKIWTATLPRYYFLPSSAGALSSIECHYTFSAKGRSREREILQLQPHLDSCSVNVFSKFEDRKIEEEVVIKRSSKTLQERLTQYQLSEQKLRPAEISSLEYEIIRPTKLERVGRGLRGPKKGQQAGASLVHFLPERISVVFDATEQQARQIVEAFIRGSDLRYRQAIPEMESLLTDKFKNVIVRILSEASEDPKLTASTKKRFNDAINKLMNDFSMQNFSFAYRSLPASVRHGLIQRLEEVSPELQADIRGDRPPEYTLAYVSLPDFSEAGVGYIRQFFSRLVKYLGPLRDEPKPIYPLSGATDPGDIGFRGEHTASVLDVYRNTDISYIPSEAFTSGTPTITSRSVPLLTAVLDWLAYMGIAQELETVDKGKLGHELRIATMGDDPIHDLTHVGVGVSQVLPILVLSLLAERGSTLIFEQPELHLHPRVQTRLAEFFVSMTLLKKQCIVETHSEYLINRLRYLAAITDDEQISKDVIIYFVEKEKEYSTYRLVRMNRFGVIEDWPKGFFDENEQNAAAILKAGMNKRKKELQKKDA